MITLKQAESVEEVDLILRDPELFDRIAEDGIKNYQTPFDGHQRYMMIMKGDTPIGVWNLYPVNTATLNIHCNILAPHREHGKLAGHLILDWFVNDCPDQYQKLNAEIPKIYPEVYHFTKNFGFQDEGINRLSISKNGQLVDQWRLGITRQEVAESIREAA
jgi:RimJ/RimL family protein N-acetyltransferase